MKIMREKNDVQKQQMTPAEETVMLCLWESGEDLTVYELTERLNQLYGKDYSNNVVATFMKNLLKKGLVSRYKTHHSHQWRPELDMEEYRRQKLDGFAKQWYHGSGVSMMASFVETRDISKEDFLKMKELLDEHMD